MNEPREKDAYFGFQRVRAEEKAGMVRGVFDSVASNYDLMNDLMSGGVHRIWKSVLLDRLNPQPGQHLVDVAGGTGDIAAGFSETGKCAAEGVIETIRPCLCLRHQF